MVEITADFWGIIFILLVTAGVSAIWLTWLGIKETSFPRFRPHTWFMPYFVLGAISGIAAVLIESSPLSDPYQSLEGFAGLLGSSIFSTGLIEEGMKFAAFLLVTRACDPLREHFDAAVGGATVGLGFAVLENVVYGLYLDPSLSLIRSFLTIQGHMFYSAVPALCFAMTKLDLDLSRRRGRAGLTAFGFAMAILIHGLRNSFIALGMNFGVLILADLGILGLLAALISRAGVASPYRTYPWRDWEPALAAIKRGLDFDPDNPNLLFRRGLYNLSAGGWVDACVAFDGVVETGRRRDLARSLERAMLQRTALRAEVRSLTKILEWTPRRG
jgi:protease PrsW